MPNVRRRAACALPSARLALSALAAPAALAACAGGARVPSLPRREPAPPRAPDVTARALAWQRDTLAERVAGGASLRAVRVVDARTVWASGSAGTVLRSADGGRSWRRVGPAEGAALDFRSLWALDSLTAVVASAGDGAEGQARVFRTVDGGRRWTLVLADTAKGAFFDALAVWPDGRHGVLLSDPVGGAFVVWTTADAGVTWRRTPREGMPAARDGDGAFAAGNAALAVAGSVHAWFVTGGPAGARVLATRTGGARWDAATPPIEPRGEGAGGIALAFRDTLVGVAMGGTFATPPVPGAPRRQIAVTRDGGRTWQPGDAGGGAPGTWEGITHVPGTPATFVAVGLPGTARSDDAGRTWGIVDALPLHAVSVGRDGAIWAVGGRGRVVRGEWR